MLIPYMGGILDAESPQVEEWKDKAEKYDQITISGTRPVTSNWLRDQSLLLLALEDENRRLREKLNGIQKWFDWCKSEMTAPMVVSYEELLVTREGN